MRTALDAHIESLRKDVEDSLDHIDDELFANLVSRVSYLKMRREWALEAPPSHAPTTVASGEPDAATHNVSASSEDALRAGVEDAVALLEQTRAASQMHRTREEETQHKKKKGQVAHVRWSEHDQVREYQVPTPDKSVTEEEDEAEVVEEKLAEHNRIVAIIGQEDGLGVESLQGAGRIAAETSIANREIFTLGYSTARNIGIGSYVLRLGLVRHVLKTRSSRAL